MAAMRRLARELPPAARSIETVARHAPPNTGETHHRVHVGTDPRAVNRNFQVFAQAAIAGERMIRKERQA